MPKPASRPALRFLIPALLFIGLAVFLLRGLDRNPQEIPSPLIGKPAPAWRMTRLTDVPEPLGQKAPGLPPAQAGTPGGNPQAAGSGNTAADAGNAAGAAGSTAGAAPALPPASAGTRGGNLQAAGSGNTAADAGNTAGTASAATGSGAMESGAGTAPQLEAAQLHGEPYLLNVWASWCMPCLEEHPQLLKLAEQHPIRVVGLNYKDKPDDARKWLRRNGNPFDDIVQDERGRTAIDFGVYGVPETFLIDGEGRIRFKHVGAITPEVLTQRLLPAIDSLKTGR